MQSYDAAKPDPVTLPSDVSTTYIYLEVPVVVVGGVDDPVACRSCVAPVVVDQCVVISYIVT